MKPRPAANHNTGSDPAFEAAFEQHWGRVVAVLQRLVGDPAQAEDLALEAFWRLHQQPPRPGGSLAGWLYRVATNLGLNALRARQRRQHYEDQAGRLEAGAGPADDPALQVERRQERQRVREVLGGMKPRDAQLLLLRHSGLSYAELAEALQVAPGSIGALLNRAEAEFERRYRRQEGEG
jgi:RNA polymerase sigma-70 factor (ECF subfamily)